jgi:hypothetical protein
MKIALRINIETRRLMMFQVEPRRKEHRSASWRGFYAAPDIVNSTDPSLDPLVPETRCI